MINKGGNGQLFFKTEALPVLSEPVSENLLSCARKPRFSETDCYAQVEN